MVSRLKTDRHKTALYRCTAMSDETNEKSSEPVERRGRSFLLVSSSLLSILLSWICKSRSFIQLIMQEQIDG